ncbi:MAG: hypothetical protein HY512_02785 [Candidatus Aenigmarchaeota archaeon]|nr:hypothetical protein [Candidatus Aenigmarchaeota archaeon]
MAGLDVLLGNMQQLKFFDFLFPFLLALAIFYGVLMFALGPHGADKKQILPKSAIALISLVASFFVMNYTGTVGTGISTFFSGLFGGGLIVASAILIIIVLFGLTGFRLHEQVKGKWLGLMLGIIVLVGVTIFFGASGSIPGLQGLNLDSNFWTIVIFIVILIAVLALLGK